MSLPTGPNGVTMEDRQNNINKFSLMIQKYAGNKDVQSFVKGVEHKVYASSISKADYEANMAKKLIMAEAQLNERKKQQQQQGQTQLTSQPVAPPSVPQPMYNTRPPNPFAAGAAAVPVASRYSMPLGSQLASHLNQPPKVPHPAQSDQNNLQSRNEITQKLLELRTKYIPYVNLYMRKLVAVKTQQSDPAKIRKCDEKLKAITDLASILQGKHQNSKSMEGLRRAEIYLKSVQQGLQANTKETEKLKQIQGQVKGHEMGQINSNTNTNGFVHTPQPVQSNETHISLKPIPQQNKPAIIIDTEDSTTPMKTFDEQIRSNSDILATHLATLGRFPQLLSTVNGVTESFEQGIAAEFLHKRNGGFVSEEQLDPWWTSQPRCTSPSLEDEASSSSTTVLCKRAWEDLHISSHCASKLAKTSNKDLRPVEKITELPVSGSASVPGWNSTLVNDQPTSKHIELLGNTERDNEVAKELEHFPQFSVTHSSPKNGTVLILECSTDNVPPLILKVPLQYPQAIVEYSFTNEYYSVEYLQRIRRTFEGFILSSKETSEFPSISWFLSSFLHAVTIM